MKAFFSVVSAVVVIAACGGTSGGGDASTDGSTDGANNGDGGANLVGPYACGAKTCMTGEYCVHPCCGGAPPQCAMLPDSGMCPQGTHLETTCMMPSGLGPGCRPDPCMPPPPYCAATDACIGGAAQKRDVSCICG